MRQTTNYGLKITEGNDDWRNIFDDNADNMDAIDAAIAPMTGATVSSDGTSGVVPEPESGDQNKFLKGDASWAIPGVMTVNGRSPDASGNITVIEGGGSSSYGSYRLDATIPVSAWTGDGPYVATVSNQYITANMDGTETWLDDETAMLGDTTFTTSNGLLTISTTVKPTAEWSLHIALAVNGADVLADISNIREDVDDNTTAITGLSTNKAYQISIANADAIAAVYNKLNALTTGTTATIYIGGTAMSNLTNSAYSSVATGTVGKVTSSNYRFNLVVGNNTPIQIDQSGMSSSSWGTSTVNDVSSTLVHGTAIAASSLSALKTNLLSVANKADVNGFIAVKITPSFTSDGFTSGSNYGGHIYNIYKSNGSTTYFSAIVSNNLGEDVLIGYSNGTWYFSSLKKNIDTLNSAYAHRGNGGANTPAFNALTVVGTVATGVDVLTWGGGNESANSGNNAGGIMYDHLARRYAFRAKDTSNTYYHQYVLPNCSDASSNKSYDILTTEVYPFVRVAGGSPGGSSNSVTFTAPGDGRHAILCYAVNMSHIFHINAIDSTVYSDGIASGFTLTKSNATYTLTRSNTTVFSYVVLWI